MNVFVYVPLHSCAIRQVGVCRTRTMKEASTKEFLRKVNETNYVKLCHVRSYTLFHGKNKYYKQMNGVPLCL